MRNQDKLFYKMKKKPALQKIIDELKNYSLEELEHVKGQPKWICQQLVKLKRTKEHIMGEPELNARLAADRMMKNSTTSQQPPKVYSIYRWRFQDWYLPSGRHGTYKVLIQEGDYLIVDEKTRVVRISSSQALLNQQAWDYFKQNVHLVDYMTLLDFSKFISLELEKKHGLIQTSLSSHPGGFTITKHGTTSLINS